MRIKDATVQCSFYPALTVLLMAIDFAYRQEWDKELVITSGSEFEAKHSRTSLHYSGNAADIRLLTLQGRSFEHRQHSITREVANMCCDSLGIPYNFYDIVLEKDHIHIEYQPKRIDSQLT